MELQLCDTAALSALSKYDRNRPPMGQRIFKIHSYFDLLSQMLRHKKRKTSACFELKSAVCFYAGGTLTSDRNHGMASVNGTIIYYFPYCYLMFRLLLIRYTVLTWNLEASVFSVKSFVNLGLL